MTHFVLEKKRTNESDKVYHVTCTKIFLFIKRIWIGQIFNCSAKERVLVMGMEITRKKEITNEGMWTNNWIVNEVSQNIFLYGYRYLQNCFFPSYLFHTLLI